jgi:DNA-binding MarR family transcriptional regulator
MTETINEQIGELIFSLSRCLKDRMMFHSTTSQLTIMQLQALAYIHEKKRVSMSEIAVQFSITLPTATSLLDKLVSMKLVKREQSKEDRRVVYIVLTEKGGELLGQALQQKKEKMHRMLSYLSKEEKQQFHDILKHLMQELQKDEK